MFHKSVCIPEQNFYVTKTRGSYSIIIHLEKDSQIVIHLLLVNVP